MFKMIRRKDALYNRFIKNRDPDALHIFKTYRNNLNKELKNAKKRYYSSLFSASSGRTDVMWKHLGSLVKGAPVSNTIETLLYKGVYVTGKDLANVFNDHFVNLGSTVDGSDSCKYNQQRNCNSIFLEPITSTEVRNVIMQQKNSASCDVDEMQIRPIKYVIDIIAPVLTYIFNLSFETGVFPTRMQIAKVSVLYKKKAIKMS